MADLQFLIAQTASVAGFDLTPIIGSGPIGVILALFIYLFREKDKQLADLVAKYDKAIEEKEQHYHDSLAARDTLMATLQAKYVESQLAQLDRYHRALAAIAESQRVLVEEKAVIDSLPPRGSV